MMLFLTFYSMCHLELGFGVVSAVTGGGDSPNKETFHLCPRCDSCRNATTCLSVSVSVRVVWPRGQCVSHSGITLSHSRASNTEHIFRTHTLNKNDSAHTFCSSVECLEGDEDTDAATKVSSFL